ncbi:MAG: nucleotide exchange factor GrpE [Candidatus Roizmanbacteria bacterium]
MIDKIQPDDGIVEDVIDVEQDDIAHQLEEMTKQSEDNKQKYLRALADYQNYENRSREERAESIERAQANLILKIMPFLDNLEQAEIFIKDAGLKMIKNTFESTLKNMGLKEIEVLGKEFDPYVAEAVDIVEGEKDDINVEVLRRGYMYNDRVIRPAQVKVSKKIVESQK